MEIQDYVGERIKFKTESFAVQGIIQSYRDETITILDATIDGKPFSGEYKLTKDQVIDLQRCVNSKLTFGHSSEVDTLPTFTWKYELLKKLVQENTKNDRIQWKIIKDRFRPKTASQCSSRYKAISVREDGRVANELIPGSEFSWDEELFKKLVEDNTKNGKIQWAIIKDYFAPKTVSQCRAHFEVLRSREEVAKTSSRSWPRLLRRINIQMGRRII